MRPKLALDEMPGWLNEVFQDIARHLETLTAHPPWNKRVTRKSSAHECW